MDDSEPHDDSEAPRASPVHRGNLASWALSLRRPGAQHSGWHLSRLAHGRTDRHGHCVPGRRAAITPGPGVPVPIISPGTGRDYDRAATCHGTLAVPVTDSGSLGLTRIEKFKCPVDRNDSEAFKKICPLSRFRAAMMVRAG
jgi:hypothetical protein